MRTSVNTNSIRNKKSELSVRDILASTRRAPSSILQEQVFKRRITNINSLTREAASSPVSKSGAKTNSISDQALNASFEEALSALSEGEVPVGCVFVYKNAIIAKARNQINATKNAT
uniref:CMP/dCMP-type deaminase domain-containing protein n=1 Tax=Glossina pallidipes TaxID=7398 RepID=A0A1A9ZLC4_GLOPL